MANNLAKNSKFFQKFELIYLPVKKNYTIDHLDFLLSSLNIPLDSYNDLKISNNISNKIKLNLNKYKKP